MEPSAQQIKVAALIGGCPTTERGEENLSQWKYEFSLAPVPSHEWQSHFESVLEREVAGRQKSGPNDGDGPEDNDDQWEIQMSPQSPGVIVAECPPDEMKALFMWLKELVKRANENSSKNLNGRQQSEVRKASILKEIEELKHTLDFDN